MNQRRVAITGLGVVSPFGGDLQDFFARLLAGESAVRFLHTDDIPRPLNIPFVSCPCFDPETTLGLPLAGTMDRFAQLGTAAAFSAWQDAGLARQSDENRDDWGVSWGTALGGVMAYEKGYKELWIQGRSRISPLWMRAISSRLVTISASLSDFSLRLVAISNCPALSRGWLAASISAMPTSAASGVRKSWDSAASRELRSRSDSIWTVALWATSM